MYPSHSAAKAAGWFSRRNRTNEALMAYREQQAGRLATWERGIREREAAANSRTPWEQLKRLDVIMGPNKGAKRERAKLHARINLIESVRNSAKGVK